MADALPEDPLGRDDEYRARLTPLQYEVARQGGTEPAFTGELWDAKQRGTYRCICCDEPLFRSETKYDSGTGWPSFTESLDPARVRELADTSHGMVRVEARCATCDAHLGHVFPDGPAPTGQRFCMNSASLRLDPDPDPAQGHGSGEDPSAGGTAEPAG